MSGAVGHLKYVHENRQLTFGEIKDVIRRASEGKLEHVSEKIDGMNLMFTWDFSSEQLRVARNTSDIKNGGMKFADLASRFYGRGNVEKAFTSAFQVLRDAISFFNDRMKIMTFGNRGQLWYSMEVIYASDPNVINYDSNNIVFHGYPVFQSTEDGVEEVDDPPGIELLTQNIDKMQSAVTMKNWRVRGPAIVSMAKLANGEIANDAIDELLEIQAQTGASDDDTLDDYVRMMIAPEVASLNIKNLKLNDMIIDRVAGIIGAPTVNDIKKVSPRNMHETIAALNRRGPELQKAALAPIERTMHTFAIEILRGVHSTLVNGHEEEINRLRSDVLKAISAIKNSGSELAMDVLQKEMSRLGSVENIGSTLEGIVFIYKGHAYKFTGSFAPVHQILALFKYGRKGIPKMSME
jgi:hypothetical protein